MFYSMFQSVLFTDVSLELGACSEGIASASTLLAALLAPVFRCL